MFRPDHNQRRVRVYYLRRVMARFFAAHRRLPRAVRYPVLTLFNA